MKPETLFLAVNLLDRVLAKKRVDRQQLRLVGVTAILIASKHEELAPQGVQNLVFRLPTHSCQDLLITEAWMLREVDYKLTMLTPLRALEFLRISFTLDPLFLLHASGARSGCARQLCARQLGVEMWEMARYLLELSLCEYAEVRERASVLAAAAALLALHSYQMEALKAARARGTHAQEAEESTPQSLCR